MVEVSRAVLWDAIGPGPHCCHWCGRVVRWIVGGPRGVKPGQLVADHVDGDPLNNATANLVPACQSCNVGRTHPHKLMPGEPVKRSSTTHARLSRAEERQCAICGTTFLRLRALTNPKHGRCCSLSCAQRLRWQEGGIGRHRKS